MLRLPRRRRADLLADMNMVEAWATGRTDKSKSQILTSIRTKLVFYDRQARQMGLKDDNGCTLGNTVDFYHDNAFEESGLSPFFYGGNLWPQDTWPNPAPKDPRK
ncbi:hypothetical protein [Pseudomonas sp. RIT-PI-AD]|uniref:hypothetical protein n=1 Tax=Pseudomonas sp. RIT-PI-AD TaxID=3035294 RepID=UPI0021D8F26D|nr:hypothetical protein [Pseudomonas sp. RIT-PI-AD]